jgi:hypothetical protein
MMKDAIVEFKVFTRTSGREVLDAMKREQRGLEQQELEQQAEVSRLVLSSLVLELALLLVLARLALLLLLVLVLALANSQYHQKHCNDIGHASTNSQ